VYELAGLKGAERVVGMKRPSCANVEYEASAIMSHFEGTELKVVFGH